MRLPPELRVMVYHFALHDVTDPIVFAAAGELREPKLCRAALALLHTSNHIRQECSYAMWPNANRLFKDLCAAFEAVFERTSKANASVKYGSFAYDQATNEFNRAYRQTICMSGILEALLKAKRAVSVHLWAQYEKEKAARKSVKLYETNERAQ